jgi:hypothetical protein
MVTAIFRLRSEALTATDPRLVHDAEEPSMPDDPSNTVPCCVTEISMGCIRWEWQQGYWIITGKSAASPAQKRHKPSAIGS